MTQPIHVHFWAKTTDGDRPGISVAGHMENVGCVARCLAELAPSLLERFAVGAAEAGALAALHDLGKISPGFQRKSAVWLEASGLTELARRWAWDTTMESHPGDQHRIHLRMAEFARRYALAGQVVILDEVRSYGVYQCVLIDKLSSTLEDLGRAVIGALSFAAPQIKWLAICGQHHKE